MAGCTCAKGTQCVQLAYGDCCLLAKADGTLRAVFTRINGPKSGGLEGKANEGESILAYMLQLVKRESDRIDGGGEDDANGIM
jgi:hypothetical protein